MLLTARTIARTTDRLAELGLRPGRPNTWSGKGLHLGTDDGWLRLNTKRRPAAASGGLDAPGLWKSSTAGGRVFEAPLDAILQRIDDAGFDDHPEVAVITMLATWAVQTLDGDVRKGWAPPAVDRLDELVPLATLSFRAGSLLEPARLVSLDRTLRVQVSLGRIEGALSAERRQWIDRLVLDARRLRLVRVDIRSTPEAATSIEAAIDLTGASTAIGEAMLPVAVDALRHCFNFLAPTATIVGDARCASRVLDTVPS